MEVDMPTQPKPQFKSIGEKDIITLPASFTDTLANHWEMFAKVTQTAIETMLGDSNRATQNAAHILQLAFDNFKEDFEQIGENPDPQKN